MVSLLIPALLCCCSWIEFWQRKQRQYYCHTQTWTETTFGLTAWTPHYAKPGCMQIDDDLRQAWCSNKQSQQLLEVLKSELECGWDAGVRDGANGLLVLTLTGVSLWLGVAWQG